VRNSRIRGWSESRRYLLLIYRVSFALRCYLVVMLGFRFTLNTVMRESIVLCSIRARCRRKKVHVRYLIY